MSIRKGTVLISGHGAVNDPTVSFTQGGASRGSITLNQANSATIAFESGGSCPVGTVCAFAGSSAPIGWLICNGGEISRTTYADLFSVIETTYGAGDGSTTFNLPTLNAGQVPIGMSGSYIGQSQNGCLPNITGNLGEMIHADELSGAFYERGYRGDRTYPDAGSRSSTAGFDANLSNSIYGSGWYSGAKVIPAGTGVSYIIKY